MPTTVASPTTPSSSSPEFAVPAISFEGTKLMLAVVKRHVSRTECIQVLIRLAGYPNAIETLEYVKLREELGMA